jgi:hypothetical protein
LYEIDGLIRAPVALLAPINSATALAVGAAAIVIFALLWKRPSLRLWLMWCLAYLGALVVLDIQHSTGTIQVSRYLIPASPAVYAIIAGAVPANFRWLRHAIPAAVVCACLFFLPRAYYPLWKMAIDPNDPHDFRTAAALVERYQQPGDAMVIMNSRQGDYFLYVMYIGLAHYLPRMPEPTFIFEQPPAEAMLRQLQRFPRVWLVTGHNDRPDVNLVQMPDMKVIPLLPTAAAHAANSR